MHRYTPFLKLKSNELEALLVLDDPLKEVITPFFDVAFKPDMTGESFCEGVQKSSRKIAKCWGGRRFYLDIFDIPDYISVNGGSPFHFIADEFSDLEFIPVVGVDRHPDYVAAVFASKFAGKVHSSAIAFRIADTELESFAAIDSDLSELLVGSHAAGFEHIVLLLDMRFCLNREPVDLAAGISRFLTGVLSKYQFSEIIIAGSSIPASVAELLGTGAVLDSPRTEISVFRLLSPGYPYLGFADYTIVSPYYTEVNLPPEVLQNIMAPKIVYSHGDLHHITRGGALKGHPRGLYQFNDMAALLVGRSFFRGAGYSFGENYLIDKAQMKGNRATPSAILKPTICAHITYMLRGHSLFV